MVDLSPALLLRGSETPRPEQHLLQAGPLTALLENGALRSIKVGDQEVLRSIYAAVRDQNWGTLEPRFLSYEVEQRVQSFQVHFTAEHTRGEIDFIWQGTIEGYADGNLLFDFSGEARSTFLRNRIGFCVLHPMEQAGLAVEIETPDGLQQLQFPEHIAPHQPFKEMLALRYSLPGLAGIQVELRLSGDLFETEDQRNWTDASFKTYCTPLRLPYPVQVQAGTQIQQRITLHLIGDTSLLTASTSSAPVASLTVLDLPIASLPRLGLGHASAESALTSLELARLRALNLSHLWVELDLTDKSWQTHLHQAAAEAQSLAIDLELSLLCDDQGEDLEALLQQLANENIPVARIFAFPRSGLVTTNLLIQKLRELRAQNGLPFLIGGGSRANFTELNRASLPLADLDLVGYHLNPQVHAFDDLSLLETLQAQSITVRDAHLLANNLPLSVGPVTFKPRFNPVATGALAALQPGELPSNVDLRQLSLFGAAWTLGSLAALAEAKWLTYYETVGWRGLLESAHSDRSGTPFPQLPGAVFPLYHLFADLAAYQRGTLLAVERSSALHIQALALRSVSRLQLLLANASPHRLDLALSLPPAASLQSLRVLDEQNVEQALFAPETYRAQSQQKLDPATPLTHLTLNPYAYVRIEASLEE